MIAALRCAGVSDSGGARAGIDNSSASNGIAAASDAARCGEQGAEFLDPRTWRIRGGEAGGATQMLDHRVKRAVAVIGRALQMDAGVRLGDERFLQRLDRARFADPGLADHGDDLALALARQAPAVEHQPHFVRAPDERQIAAGADRGEAALD